MSKCNCENCNCGKRKEIPEYYGWAFSSGEQMVCKVEPVRKLESYTAQLEKKLEEAAKYLKSIRQLSSFGGDHTSKIDEIAAKGIKSIEQEQK